MKRKTKQKLPKFDFGKPPYIGYQRALLNGVESISTPGYNLLNDANALRSNTMPYAIHQFSTPLTNTANILRNFAPSVPIRIAAPSSAVLNDTLNIAKNTVLDSGGKEIIKTAPKVTPVKMGMSSPLNALGKISSVLSIGQGLYGLGDVISRSDDTISANQIALTRGTNTYTTDRGNTYIERTGPDAGAALAYDRQLMRQKRIDASAASAAIGAGVSSLALGSTLGAWAGPLGLFAGGLLGYGLSSLFGLGDNEDEVKRRNNLVGDVTSMLNLQSETLAKNNDARTNFYDRGTVSAKDGKLPKCANGKANAWLSHGETVVHNDGTFEVLPGKPDKKDTLKRHIKNSDAVLSNNGGSQYFQLTGDLPGALVIDEKYRQMKNLRNGKLPKYSLGTAAEYILPMIPHFATAATNWGALQEAKNADVSTKNVYTPNYEGAAAVNALAGLKYDASPYLAGAERAYRLAGWDTSRNVGLGIGGRAIAKNALYRQYIDSLAGINAQKNEADAKYSLVYANALLALGAANQQHRINAAANEYLWLQLAKAAKLNYIAQYRKNLDTSMMNSVAEWMKQSQYRQALAIQNQMLRLYERQADTEDIKAQAQLKSLAGNNVNYANLLNTYDTLKGMSFVPNWGFLKLK